jgi:hypothetical protein
MNDISGIPVWLWGAMGGLLLGIVGFLILFPACGKSPQKLLKHFVIAVLVKLILVGLGLWISVKLLAIEAVPLVFGLFLGYILSLFLEILPCIWKIRRCMHQDSQIEP